MKHIFIISAALAISACASTPTDCRQSLYGCNEGRAVTSETARPATPTKQEKPTERPGPIKPDKPAGHKPHGDKNHSGPRGHGKNGGWK